MEDTTLSRDTYVLSLLRAAAVGSMSLTALMVLGCSSGGTSDSAAGPPSDPATENAAAAEPQATQAALEIEQPAHMYTIELGGPHSITYRAYADGALSIAEKGRLDPSELHGITHSVRSFDPVQVFQDANPGATVPGELLQLKAFMDNIEPATEIEDETRSVGSGSMSPIPEAGPNIGLLPKDITSDPASFTSMFGCFFGPNDAFKACVPNWPGTAFAQWDSRWAIYKMAPFEGLLRFQVSISNSPRFADFILPGGFLYLVQAGTIRLRDNGQRRYPDLVTHRLDIFEAGQSHWSARFHNFKMSSGSCAEVWATDLSKPGQTQSCVSHYGDSF